MARAEVAVSQGVLESLHMRVVAGVAGGRRLKGPPGPTTRATTDKVREAAFNALAGIFPVEGASVADLFAGTGACGIEALSRGAAEVTFVDHDAKSLSVVRANLAITGLSGSVVKSDVLKFVSKTHHFDIAICDPPYRFDQWDILLGRLSASVAVCESDRAIKAVEGWSLVRERRYGDTVVIILEADGQIGEADGQIDGTDQL